MALQQWLTTSANMYCCNDQRTYDTAAASCHRHPQTTCHTYLHPGCDTPPYAAMLACDMLATHGQTERHTATERQGPRCQDINQESGAAAEWPGDCLGLPDMRAITMHTIRQSTPHCLLHGSHHSPEHGAPWGLRVEGVGVYNPEPQSSFT